MGEKDFVLSPSSPLSHLPTLPLGRYLPQSCLVRLSKWQHKGMADGTFPLPKIAFRDILLYVDLMRKFMWITCGKFVDSCKNSPSKIGLKCAFLLFFPLVKSSDALLCLYEI